MLTRTLLKGSSAFFIALILSGLIVPLASADGMAIPFTPPYGYLQVDYHHVFVSIMNDIAFTRVEQRFSNPYPDTIEARYVFPIPGEASLHEFIVRLDGELVEVEKLDILEAMAYLREAILNQGDPSLLQYYGWEAYAVSFTLHPRTTKSMTLEYSEWLPSEGDLFHYFYTLGTERYSVGLIEDVIVRVDIQSDDGIATIYSPSHDIHIERLSPNNVRVEYRGEDVLPVNHFDLYYTLTDRPFNAGLLTYADLEHQDAGHFLLLLSPSSLLQSANATPKDIVFVIDRSGSMAGDKIEQAKRALQFILGQLDERDRFAIVSFDDSIESLSGVLQSATLENTQHARSYVQKLYDRGSTDIDRALRRALEILQYSERREGASRTIIFLTDGLPTSGITYDDAIVDRVRQGNERVGANIHVFGVGYDVNTHLLDRIASQNHGAVTYVLPGENLEIAMTNFYDQIAHPLLTSINITFDGFAVQEIYPKELSDVFLGSSIVLTGQYANLESNQVVVHLFGERVGKPWSEDFLFEVDSERKNVFIPRLWATRRVGDLLDRVRVEGETAYFVDEIESLGLRYGIVTPYTIDIVQGQVNGPASVYNMQLYQQDLDGDGRPDINQVSGAATVGARAQNLAYQQSIQANQAIGANIVQSGDQNLAQLGSFVLDMNLFINGDLHFDTSIDTWIGDAVDRIIQFGSDAYFELAEDPIANKFLQAGQNVIFELDGDLISVQTDASPKVAEKATNEGRSFGDWIWSLLEAIFLWR